MAEKKEKMKLRNKKLSTLKKIKPEDDDPYGSSQKKSNPQHKEATDTQVKRVKTKRSILSKIESLNVDIPSNREQFRLYYEKILKDLMKAGGQLHYSEEADIQEDDNDEFSAENDDETREHEASRFPQDRNESIISDSHNMSSQLSKNEPDLDSKTK